MAFEEQLPQWENEGTQPPQSKRVEGWLPNEKPPASWFNWLFGRTYRVLKEFQEKAAEKVDVQQAQNTADNALTTANNHASRHATGGADEITPGMIGAAPISHGSEHNHDGADPIPDLVQLREGVIIESGENANGRYVLFADGTFIAYRRVTRPADELYVEYTAPARGILGQEFSAFAASEITTDPARLESAGMLNVRSEGSGWGTRLSPNFFVEGATIRLDLILIGRWM